MVACLLRFPCMQCRIAAGRRCAQRKLGVPARQRIAAKRAALCTPPEQGATLVRLHRHNDWARGTCAKRRSEPGQQLHRILL